jgi:hypothetical protein
MLSRIGAAARWVMLSRIGALAPTRYYGRLGYTGEVIAWIDEVDFHDDQSCDPALTPVNAHYYERATFRLETEDPDRCTGRPWPSWSAPEGNNVLQVVCVDGSVLCSITCASNVDARIAVDYLTFVSKWADSSGTNATVASCIVELCCILRCADDEEAACSA